MLLTKIVEIPIHNTLIKHFESLGYKIPRSKDKKGRMTVTKGTKVKVKVEDLTNNSIVPVQCLCDYCLEKGKETIVTKGWREYLQGREIIEKDCCAECQSIKYKEICNIKYGVDNVFQLDDIKKKSKETMKEKYGETSYMKTEEGKEKVKNTMLEKYGVEYAIQNNQFKEKMYNTMLKQFGVTHYTQCEEGMNKIRETNLGKYGTEYVGQVEKFKEKSKQTSLERYGVTSYTKTEEFKNIISGENHPCWKGGISQLSDYLRHKIPDWKKESLKQYNYKCALSEIKDQSIEIHHLHSFSDIVEETMLTLNLPIYQEINKYTDEELKLIEDKCIELHNQYGLGVPLLHIIHILFHKEYGCDGNTTNEDFEEFKQRYNNGEFDKILKINNNIINNNETNKRIS